MTLSSLNVETNDAKDNIDHCFDRQHAGTWYEVVNDLHYRRPESDCGE